MNRPSPFASLWNALKSLAHDPATTRLDAYIEETRSAIQRADAAAVAGAIPVKDAIVARCLKQLDTVEQAGHERRFFVAYAVLKDIRRELVALMSDDERRAEMATLLAEAETAKNKLNDWRREASRRLAALAAVPDGDAAPSVAVLQAMMRNVDEAQQNRQHKLELVQRQVLWLCLLLLAAVFGIAVLAACGRLDWIAATGAMPTLTELLPTAVATGFFGGLLSLAYGLTSLEARSSIQDMRSSLATTITRPLIGAAVAIPILLFLKSGLIVAEAMTPVVLLSLCFVGGFSERWFLAQVDRISGGK